MRQKKEKENGKNRLNFMMIRLFLVFINTHFLKDTFKHQGLRKQLVSILKNKGINDKFVLDAIQNIPRHLFMDSSFLDHAYQDKAFPIGADQTISQPYTVAFQTELLKVNKGDKMTLLYDYLIGNEFGEQWKAVGEGFRQMRQSIQRERDAMEKLWKSREKQLEKVLLNAMHIKGSIEGIAGADAINLNLLDDEEQVTLEE